MSENAKKFELVSVITPLYNSERYVAETIESVRAQTYQHWEMLIVDDCSTDSSKEVVRSYSRRDERIALIELAENRGPAVARNAGIERAKGRFIIFLDSDDVWYPTLLETLTAYMEEKNAAVVFASFDRTNENKTVDHGPFCVPSSVTYHDLLKTCSISCLTGMYDTQKVGKVYMPDFPRREDYALWLDILKKTPRAYGYEKPLALYRMRENSFSRNKLLVAYHQWRIYRTREHLSLLKSLFYFSSYAYQGTRKYVRLLWS